MSRRTLIVAAVVLLHAFGLWALQAGLLQRAVAIVVPVEVLADIIEAPAPQSAPAPEPTPPQRLPDSPPVVKIKTPPRPAPKTTPTATPESAAPAASDKLPTWSAPIALPSNPAAAPVVTPVVSPPAAPRIELPSSQASYLNNVPPRYPALSKRLGEQGKVVVRTLIAVDGTAQQASVKTSSGYERLDQTALQTVRAWRYVPGKRAGVPEAMWFDVPLAFVLDP